MADEIDLEVDGAHRAAMDASRLLQNEAFNDAYSSLISDVERQLFMSELGDTEKREQLFHLHRAAQMFVNNIARRINEFELKRTPELD